MRAIWFFFANGSANGAKSRRQYDRHVNGFAFCLLPLFFCLNEAWFAPHGFGH
jgi:hypothetical protein